MTASTLRTALLASLYLDDGGLDASHDAAVDLAVTLEINGAKMLKLAGGISDRGVRHEKVAGYQLAYAKQALNQIAAAIASYEAASMCQKQ